MATKASISRDWAMRRTAPTRRTAATSARASGTAPDSAPLAVAHGLPPAATQTTVAASKTTATEPAIPAARRARCLSSPLVLRERKTEPWKAKMATVASPPTSAMGLSSPSRPPV